MWATSLLSAALAALPMLSASTLAADESPLETLLLQSPTVSARQVVFVYAGDLWVADRAGGIAQHLTSSPGLETNPHFSPDGEWVAYSAQYEGNTDVYLLPIQGGTPQRLTWHPGADEVRDWRPDGTRVLFSSSRDSGTGASRLFEVPRGGGAPIALAIPRANHASYSLDAAMIAYTPARDAFGSWKRYRGGRATRIWIYDTATSDVEEVPHVGASDTYPVYCGDKVYFASDRDGHMNIYSYIVGSAGRAQPQQITHFDDFDVRSMSLGGGVIAFEQAGAIHLLDLENDSIERLRIRIVSDGLAARPRWEKVVGQVRAASIAPNGKRAVFEARGEIITVPREHGDAHNVTQSPGAHDRSPGWSPDGERLAWLSDEGGEYRLWIRDRLGRTPAKAYDLDGGGFYYDPQWSPDGAHVMFRDKTNRLAYVTLESGLLTSVARAAGELGVIDISATWSPDSQWIAFELRNPRTLYDRIALFRVESGQTTVLTDAFGDCDSPAFSRDGKYLFFTSSIDSGPSRFGLDMESSVARGPDNNIYLVVLQKDAPHPFAPKNDAAVGDDDEDDHDDRKEGDRDHRKRDRDIVVEAIDLDGIDQRIVALPIESGRYEALAGDRDKLYFIARDEHGDGRLMSYDLEERKQEEIASHVEEYDLSSSGRAVLLRTHGDWRIRRFGHPDKSFDLAIGDVQVRVDPAVEWPQILREAWRIERDYFYDSGMHGVDWDAMWQRWSPFVRYVRHRADLNLILREMIGELCCGHEYVSGGELPEGEKGVPTGLLGADFAVDGERFRLAKIYHGQNWNPSLRAPLTEPGVDVHEGDYLIAVNGRPVTATMNVLTAFENTAGKQVSLQVSASRDGSDARTATVVPLSSDRSLRRLSWIEANRKRVDELSAGRLAYIYMPDTGNRGMAAFDRDYYSQLDKQGVIIDERFNRGGKVADYVIHVLSRSVISYWMNRERWAGRSPFALIPGPRVMVINERAGSGGDWMPWAFQKTGVGKLVGMRTWGGLVGISGYPPLMDGGRVTAASFGVMDTDGNWAVENIGVSPDFEVIQWPKDVIAGHDPQLEKAVAVALEELESMPREKLPTFKPPKKR